MRYEFKKLEEAGWFVGVAVIAFVAQAAAAANFQDVAADWQTWAVALAAGAGRAALAAVAVQITQLLGRTST